MHASFSIILMYPKKDTFDIKISYQSTHQSKFHVRNNYVQQQFYILKKKKKRNL